MDTTTPTTTASPFRLFRVYDASTYNKFKDLCAQSGWSVTRVLNQYIEKCAEKDRIVGGPK